VFIYRKPFQHLFSSVGYGMLGAEERANVSWRESGFGFRRVTAGAAGVVVPGTGASRASRWARRGTVADGTGDAAAADSGAVAAAGATVPEGTATAPVADSHVSARQWPDAGVGTGRTAPPLPLPNNGLPAAGATTAGWARGGATGTGTGARRTAQPPARQGGPPPVRQGPAPGAASRGATGSAWPGGATRPRSGESSNGAAGGAGQPAAAPFWARSRRRSK
jgi:hypothetical protein